MSFLKLVSSTNMQLKSRNTNLLQPFLYGLLQTLGVEDESRNGPVLRFNEPVLLEITHPFERVNICPIRDANPFFHLMEALAMLGKRNDVQFLAHFAKNMLNYSDDGATQNAFYGTRLGNQLDLIIRNLLDNPRSRQEVALIWDKEDLNKETKDKACNLLLMFSMNMENEVQMTSINRSNDAIWGFVSGANMVHLSMFHEYVALAMGRPMGHWWHFSNNLHVYTNNPKWEPMIKGPPPADIYTRTQPRLIPMFSEPDQKRVFDEQLDQLLAVMIGQSYKEGKLVTLPGQMLPFLRDAAAIFNVWQMYKYKAATTVEMVRHLNLHVLADDWRHACEQWLIRHEQKGLLV